MRKIALLLLCALLLTGCAAQAPAGTEDVFTVVTTIYPPADFARQIGGEAVKVIQLAPPGAEAHDFCTVFDRCEHPSPAVTSSSTSAAIPTPGRWRLWTVWVTMPPPALCLSDYVELLHEFAPGLRRGGGPYGARP